MKRLVVFVALSACLVGCGPKTGISSNESREQSKEWGQDAYEDAMIKAGREEELKAEKAKWAESQQQGQDQGSAASSTSAKPNGG